jgi:hypothetical protein
LLRCALPRSGLLLERSHGAIETSKGEHTMKTWTSILAAGAILAFAAPAGNAALGNYPDYGVSSSASGKQIKNVKKAKHAAIKVGSGPYAYLGSTAPVGAQAFAPSVTRIGP